MLPTLDGVLELVIPLDDLLTALKEQFAFRRQLPRSLRPVDQLGPEVVLDLTYCLARGGLADGVRDSRARKALVSDDVAKDAECLDVNGADTLPHLD